MNWGQDWHAGEREGRTSFTCGLELSWAAILSVTRYRASPHLNYIAGVGLQSVQLYRVLLAGDSGGDAFTLQCHENGGIVR